MHLDNADQPIPQHHVTSFRTDQLLELFEEAPDDHADWGDVVDMEEKFYKTEDEDESSSSSDFGDTDASGKSKDSIKGILKGKKKSSKNRRKQVSVRT